MKSKTDQLLDELIKLHPKYIDLSLERVKKLVEKVKIEEKIAKDSAQKCEEQLLDLEEMRSSLQIKEEAANFERSEVEG